MIAKKFQILYNIGRNISKTDFRRYYYGNKILYLP